MAEEYDAGMDEHDHDDWSEPPKWPKVVGIISIVWGVLGIVCNGLGIAGALLTPRMMKMAESGGGMEGGFPPQMTQPNVLIAGLSVVSIFAGVALLMAGIFTVNRRPQGRTLHLGVAAVSLILLVLGIGYQWHNMTQIGEWVQANPDATFSQNYSPMGSLIGMVVGVVLGGAWPTFLLIWFGALKKRPEIGAPEVL
jgi:hypothetical protein